MKTDNLGVFFQDCQYRIEQQLKKSLEAQIEPETVALSKRLVEASLYSVTNGGKRLRPGLVYASALAVDPSFDAQSLDLLAVAVEMVHCYSLVHDDLPAMDNDDLRRGKPTCHVAFDEATAILVGDGLQALGFELLASCEHYTADKRLAMIQSLARAIGNNGMVLGQALDLYAENRTLDLGQLAYLHEKKTGALIRASVTIGAIAAGADDQCLQSLEDYARCIGLAFQIQDDILDIESETSILGKQQGADLILNKSTYPSLLGIQPARDKAFELVREAIAIIDAAVPEPRLLTAIANFIIQRKY